MGADVDDLLDARLAEQGGEGVLSEGPVPDGGEQHAR
jgi:hypothetical protein